MVTQTLREMLKKQHFIEGFASGHVEKLAALAKEVRFTRDQVIFREGGECSEFYMIVSGRVALEIEAPDHVLRVQTLSAGDEFGWSALLMGSGKHFQARALEPVEALAFEGVELLAACKADTAFGFAFMQRLLGLVAGRLQATRLQVLDMHSPVAKRAGN